MILHGSRPLSEAGKFWSDLPARRAGALTARYGV